jgi:hypothetical protein
MGMKVFASAINYGAVDISGADHAVDFNAIYVGVSGDVIVEATAGGTEVTFTGAPVGWLPVKGAVIVKTGTTATNMVWANW